MRSDLEHYPQAPAINTPSVSTTKMYFEVKKRQVKEGIGGEEGGKRGRYNRAAKVTLQRTRNINLIMMECAAERNSEI